jgi:hypothetical protein
LRASKLPDSNPDDRVERWILMLRASRGLSLVLLLNGLLATASARAQTLELPRPSPAAKVSQRVGLTDIAVEYSSPGVKGRPIWGALVPYDQMWRTGANSATKVTFSQEVTIDGQKVPAGTYSLHTIPTKAEWTVILNKNPEAGQRDYKQELDVLRTKVKATEIPHRERMTFVFSDFGDQGTNLDLEWEKLKISLPIQVDTPTLAKKNIDAALAGAWRPFNDAARYLLTEKRDYDVALGYADKAVMVGPDQWFAHWTRAQLLAAKGKTKDAYASAQKAYDLGKKAEFFFFEEDVKKALADWGPKKK